MDAAGAMNWDRRVSRKPVSKIRPPILGEAEESGQDNHFSRDGSSSSFLPLTFEPRMMTLLFPAFA